MSMNTPVARPHHGFILAALFGLLALLLAACQATPEQPPASTSRGADEIRVIAREWTLEPARLALPAGRPVTLVLENRGQVEHDLTIPALNLKLVARPGQSARATVTAEQPGDYDLLCSIPGHKEAGMTGSVTVTPSAAGQGAPAEAAALATSAAKAAEHASHAAVATTAQQGNQELPARVEGSVKVFDLKAQHVRWEVLPGEFIDAYAYNGQVPGPVIRVSEGDRVRVNLTNELPEPTVLHFHGPRLPNPMDGVPDVTQKLVDPGETFAYEFEATPAGTFLYHTHHNAAVQEPKGLYGLFIVEPKVKTLQYDKELIQVLGESGGFYLINGKAFPATQALEAKVGEKVLIRLANLGQMAHPMHLHGHPFKIVAIDGYPVPEAQALTKDTVNIGPGERYDLLVELDNPGTWVFHCHILSHVQNRGVEPGGMITVLKVVPQ
jgi:FtsP/CotA-like multicopper oxidase with cupredoxin domain